MSITLDYLTARMYPAGCPPPNLHYNLYLYDHLGNDLRQSPVNKDYSYGILRLEKLPAGKYTIEVRNHGDEKEDSDFVLTTYAKDAVSILDRDNLLQEEINAAKKDRVYKKYAEDKKVKGEAYLSHESGDLSVRITNGASEDLRVTI